MFGEKVKWIYSFRLILLFLLFLYSCVYHLEYLSEPEQPISKENLKKLSRFPKLKLEYSCGFWVQKELVSPTDILGKAVCEDLPNQKEIHPFHAQLIRSFTSKGFVFSEKVENTKEPILIQKIEIRTEIIRRGPISDLIHGLLFGLYPAIDNYRIIMHHKVVNKKGDVKFEYRASRTVEVYWSSFFYLAHPFMDKPNFEFADIINVLAEDSIQKAIESDVYENF